MAFVKNCCLNQTKKDIMGLQPSTITVVLENPVSDFPVTFYLLGYGFTLNFAHLILLLL